MPLVSTNSAFQPTSAQSAFDKARQLIENKGPNEKISLWLQDKYDITDVQNAVENAKSRYDSRSKTRVRKWLARFSGVVMHYGQVIDMLVQHHPEYTSLAWGTTKFLFVLFHNHEDLLTELAKSFTFVIQTLPRVQTQADLFDLPLMRNAAQDLYTAIVLYFHEMLCFYEERRLKHAWKSFIQPFSLRFEEILKNVEAHSKHIADLAAALAQQEQRTILKTVKEILSGQSNMMSMMQVMHGMLASQQSMAVDHILITKDVRTAGMIETTRSHVFGDPQDILQFRLSFCRRRQRRQGTNIDAVWSSASLKRWNCSQDSAILLVHGSFTRRFETIAVGTYMAEFVRSSNVPTLYALQSTDTQSFAKTTPLQILKYLAFQAMKLNADTIDSAVSPNFNATRIASATTEHHWTDILCRTLAGIPIAYIVVDSELLEQQESSSAALSTILSYMLNVMKSSKPTTLKIALLSNRRGRRSGGTHPNSQCLNLDRMLQATAVVPPAQEHQRISRRSTSGRGSLAFLSRLATQASRTTKVSP